MRKHAWIVICTGFVLSLILAPYWPAVLFWGAFLWLACPHYNVLSPTCGEFTIAFVLLRLIQVVFLCILAHALSRLITRGK